MKHARYENWGAPLGISENEGEFLKEHTNFSSESTSKCIFYLGSKFKLILNGLTGKNFVLLRETPKRRGLYKYPFQQLLLARNPKTLMCNFRCREVRIHGLVFNSLWKSGRFLPTFSTILNNKTSLNRNHIRLVRW